MTLIPHAGPVVGDAMLFEYVKHRDPSDINYLDILDTGTGDFANKCPVLWWAQLFSHAYVYSFNHRTERTYQIYGWPNWTGTATIN